MSLREAATIQIVPLPDGTYRALCAGIDGAFADGSTPAEAERGLLAMLDTRFEEKAVIGKRENVEVDPDADDDDDPMES